MKKQLIKRADIAVISAAVIIALTLFIFSRSGNAVTAEISVNGTVVHEAVLSQVKEPYIYRTENGMEIEISSDKVRVLSSDCSGKNCIAAGTLDSPGSTAACVPNKTVIRLKGTRQNSPDAITF